MAGKILGGVLTFTKGHVCRLHQDVGSSRTGLFTARPDVRHPDQNRVSYLSRAWGCAISLYVSDYDGAFAELKLRPMVFADPDPLVESEGVGQPIHRCSNIWVDENWNDGCVGYRAVLLQGSTLHERSCAFPQALHLTFVDEAVGAPGGSMVRICAAVDLQHRNTVGGPS
jgi:hypothetical protein